MNCFYVFIYNDPIHTAKYFDSYADLKAWLMKHYPNHVAVKRLEDVNVSNPYLSIVSGMPYNDSEFYFSLKTK